MGNTPLCLLVEIADVGRRIYSGSCLRITAPAAAGEVGILPRHASMLTALRPGEIRLQNLAGEEHFFTSPVAFLKSRTAPSAFSLIKLYGPAKSTSSELRKHARKPNNYCGKPTRFRTGTLPNSTSPRPLLSCVYCNMQKFIA